MGETTWRGFPKKQKKKGGKERGKRRRKLEELALTASTKSRDYLERTSTR
jgi:hypothetical protein